MPFCQLRASVPQPLFKCVQDSSSCPPFARLIYNKYFQQAYEKQNLSPITVVSSSQRFHLHAISQVEQNPGQSSGLTNCCQSEPSIDSYRHNSMEVEVDPPDSSPRSIMGQIDKENERRRKIGLANKGKVPWNKGRKHTAVTREKIRQRTLEALRDPKVRQKMAEHPRSHSDQIKAKIGSSLRRTWDRRLRWKRSREKFFFSWGNSIAQAAKVGWSDQEELDWDSYDKIKEEIAAQHLQRKAQKEMAKKMQAVRAAEAKAEKMARIAQMKKERKEAKERGMRKKRAGRKPRKAKDELPMSCAEKLKQRLLKIRRKKSGTLKITAQGDKTLAHIPAWDKMDLEHVLRERAQSGLSLEDQIQAAKSRRAQLASTGVLVHSLSHYTSAERS